MPPLQPQLNNQSSNASQATSSGEANTKDELPHGQFLPASAELGYSMQDSHYLRQWYEEAKSRNLREMEVAEAEQKMSRGARREFCRADPEVKAVVIEDIAI